MPDLGHLGYVSLWFLVMWVTFGSVGSLATVRTHTPGVYSWRLVFGASSLTLVVLARSWLRFSSGSACLFVITTYLPTYLSMTSITEYVCINVCIYILCS